MTGHAAESKHAYLPGMGHHSLLPLYDPLTRLLGLRSAHRQLIDDADVRPGQRVLEIGCGTGNLTLLVKRLQPQTEVVGIDPDPKALARARRKAGRGQLAVRFDQGFAGTLPYPDASFERVLSAFMFHHLDADEKRRGFREVFRVLRPGGSLHLVDFGGTEDRSEGVIGRMARHNKHLRDNFGDRIPALMREAGLADAAETGHRVTFLGRHTRYRAVRG